MGRRCRRLDLPEDGLELFLNVFAGPGNHGSFIPRSPHQHRRLENLLTDFQCLFLVKQIDIAFQVRLHFPDRVRVHSSPHAAEESHGIGEAEWKGLVLVPRTMNQAVLVPDVFLQESVVKKLATAKEAEFGRAFRRPVAASHSARRRFSRTLRAIFLALEALAVYTQSQMSQGHRC